MKVETHNDIVRTLRKAGYSKDAVTEILKWYEKGNVDRRT